MKWAFLFLSVFNVGLGILMLVDNIRAALMERRTVVISTDCPDTARITARYRKMPDYVFVISPCDEVEEYDSLAKLYFQIQPRLMIVVVSFSRNCPALRIFQTRLRGPVILIVVGCEESINSHLEIATSERPNNVTVIQMSVPAWFPAQMVHHLHGRKKWSKAPSLVSSPSCADISNHLLRDNSKIIDQYYDLPSDPTSTLSLPSNHYYLVCLSTSEIDSFPVIRLNSSRQIVILVKDTSSISTTLAAIKKSPSIQILAKSTNMLALLQYSSPSNSTSDLFEEDVRNSFAVASILLDRSDSINVSSASLAQHNELAAVFRDLHRLANIVPVAPGRFVQLRSWKVTELRHLDTNDTEVIPRLRVEVIPNVQAVSEFSQNSPRSNDSAWTSNTTASEGWQLGYHFQDDYFNKTADIFLDGDEDVAPNSDALTIYIPIAVGAVLALVLVTAAALYSRRHYLKTHAAKDRVKFYLESDDLTPIAKRTNTSLSLTSNGTSNNLSNGKIANGHGNYADVGKSMASIRTGGSSGAQELGLSHGDNYARFNGELVFLRFIRTKNFQLKGPTRALINNLRDLRGDNINAVAGFFIGHAVPFRPPAVVFEYCSRGSLMDLIDKEEIKLDWAFKLSFLTDLVRALKAIHNSPLRYHGRLTSRKCVIDNRWTLKVTDYGISRIEAAMNNNEHHKEGQRMAMGDEQLLWTAPELLRNTAPVTDGSPKADIYSFSIIMQELIMRGRPFCTVDLSPKEIIQKVGHPPPLLRPHVPNQAAVPEAVKLMKECWAENPEMRPTADQLNLKMKALSQGRKVNIVDAMFVMLEKYSNNLEELIHERTEELNEEKKKTDQLLFRMMPQTVAEKLKTGQAIEPETFEEVTIYFSDIVGFTTISAYSDPMEVVNLLNNLYTLFDTTLSYYDVYKVETIGDAYMVVSGLPIPNGDKHTGEIASVALELLHQCGKFKIRHLYDVPLLLRIGIHTGSCAAGVVGLTMPRYCLFGDTVNTASRMESTSRAYRIHLSSSTHEKLTQSGGYKMVFRGMTFVKGKGEMQTYWLEGKEGFHKDLPTPAPDTGENHGIDETLIIKGRELQKLLDEQMPEAASPHLKDGMRRQFTFEEL